MRDNVEIVECLQELEQKGANIVGMNCFRGPTTMMPYLREARKKIKCHMAALPIPYRTSEENPTSLICQIIRTATVHRHTVEHFLRLWILCL